MREADETDEVELERALSGRAVVGGSRWARPPCAGRAGPQPTRHGPRARRGWPRRRRQTRYAMDQILRDPMSMFFAIVFPVVLVTPSP